MTASDFRFSEELASFVTSGMAIIVATRSAALEPNLSRVCGVRVAGRDRLEILVPRATGAQAIANLNDNGEIALCVSSPTNYRTVQLKGHFLGVRDGTADDLLLAQQQLRAFSALCAEFGISRQKTRNLWLFDCWCVELQVTTAFTQTPGPGAGSPVELAHGE